MFYSIVTKYANRSNNPKHVVIFILELNYIIVVYFHQEISELKCLKISVILQMFIFMILLLLVDSVLLGPGPRHPQDTVYITAFPAQFPLPRRVVSGRVGGGDPPLQACRDSAGTPRTRVRLEPAIDKTCRPRRLQSEMSGFDLCLPPKHSSHRRF